MKSPLNFLTGLIRRRPSEIQEALVVQDSDAKDGESKPQTPPPASPGSDQAENPVSEVLSSVAVIEPKAPSDSEAVLPVSPSEGAGVGSASENEATAEVPAKPRVNRRQGKDKGAVQVAVIAAVEELPAQSAPAKTFSDEVVTLDAEIDELRKQLTRKLQLQNAQLKKMLERFEGI